mmetsp:Transcript_20520/g.38925  ORF Transcript_20520/g.38925 Transcript_20520/m.38925 type:complete len:352 (+) Transcript_20520:110-1165(+)
MARDLFDFAVITIFAREFLEGTIIIGEYRTIILRGDSILERGVTRNGALREVTLSALIATALALIVIAAIAIPLSILSHSFDETTSKIIEGASKIVAGICLLQLSLKLPKFLGVYGSSKKKKGDETDDESGYSTLTLRSIRFNVIWNIWREVAECGVFLIPFFLSGDGLEAVPLSAVVGSVVGSIMGISIYYANKTFTEKISLTVFVALILLFLSAGLFTGGCHNLEVELGTTKEVWDIQGEFWDVHRLPMTVLKPFGYNDSRTVLEITCYWGWLVLGVLLHYRKYKRVPILVKKGDTRNRDDPALTPQESKIEEDTNGDAETLELGEGTVDATTLSDAVVLDGQTSGAQS